MKKQMKIKKSPQNYNEIKDTINEIIKDKIKTKYLENYFRHAFKIY